MPVRGVANKGEVLAQNKPVAGEAADQPGAKRALVGRVGTHRQQPDAINLRRRLGAGRRRPDSEGEDENDNEPGKSH